MSLLNLWSLYIQVNPVPPPQFDGQNYSPSSTHKTETSSSSPSFAANKPSTLPKKQAARTTPHKAKGRHLSYNLQQTSPANERLLYYTLEQSERNFRKKPKLESQHFHTSSSSPMQPCSKEAQHTAAQKTSISYYSRTKPKKETRASLCHSSSVIIIITRQSI